MQHTNTSSMSGGSTTSLFYRDLGARWLTTRSKLGIRRSNKNRFTLTNSPIYGWWRAPPEIFRLRDGSGVECSVNARAPSRHRTPPPVDHLTPSLYRTVSTLVDAYPSR